jgi:hypothetical protein
MPPTPFRADDNSAHDEQSPRDLNMKAVTGLFERRLHTPPSKPQEQAKARLLRSFLTR